MRIFLMPSLDTGVGIAQRNSSSILLETLL